MRRRFVWFGCGLLLIGGFLVVHANSTLTILHTNDTHSRLENMARMASVINEIRLQAPAALLLHAGDSVMGTLYYTLFKGEAEAEVLEAMGFTALTLGNHEFNQGPSGLARFAEIVTFPLLCANFDFSNEPLLVGEILPYIVVDVGGVKVGIVGLTTESTAWSSNPGPNIKISDAIATAQSVVAQLSAQGVNIIVALTHLGWDRDLELARAVVGIDVVVGGHSHTYPPTYPAVVERKLVNLNTATLEELIALPGIGPVHAQRIIEGRPYATVEDLLRVPGLSPKTLESIRPWVAVEDATVPALVVQAGEYGTRLGYLEVTFDDLGVLLSWRGELLAVDKAPLDPAIEAKLKEYQAPMDALKAEKVGETTVLLEGERTKVRTGETNLGNLIADAMLWKARAAQAQIAIQNGGGIRATLPAGPITLGQVMEVLPFGNYLVVLELTGEQIWAALENGVSQVETRAGRFPHVAGLRYAFDPTQPAGARILTVEVWEDGEWQPLKPDVVYRVVTNNFLAQGGDGYSMFLEARAREVLGFVDYEVLAEYLRLHSPVAPTVEGRIVEKKP